MSTEAMSSMNESDDVNVEIEENTNTKQKTIDIEPVQRSARPNKGIPANRFSYMARITPQEEPESWEDMLLLPINEQQKWKEAVDEEIKSLNELQTWELVQLPPGRRAIGCKWVFKVKRSGDGQIVRYKARLVAKGYAQKYGEDYESTFASVAKQSTFRTFLSVAAKKNMIVRHYDFKTAFLNGDIEDELFMS